MTWIIGSATGMGYAALIADTQVTFSDGYSLDGLQKIYPVGAGCILGFSGSVRFGFEAVNDLTTRLFSQKAILDPRLVALKWRRYARFGFRKLPVDNQILGASFLLIGSSQEQNGPFKKTYCIRMRSPEFEPEIRMGLTWMSIGSGSDHPFCIQLQNSDTLRQTLFHFGAMPFGAAQILAGLVCKALVDIPMKGVNSRFLIGIADPWKVEILPVQGEFVDGNGNLQVVKHDTAIRSWSQLMTAVASESVVPNSASC